jgi:hypothetical protein
MNLKPTPTLNASEAPRMRHVESDIIVAVQS